MSSETLTKIFQVVYIDCDNFSIISTHRTPEGAHKALEKDQLNHEIKELEEIQMLFEDPLSEYKSLDECAADYRQHGSSQWIIKEIELED